MTLTGTPRGGVREQSYELFASDDDFLSCLDRTIS